MNFYIFYKQVVHNRNSNVSKMAGDLKKLTDSTQQTGRCLLENSPESSLLLNHKPYKYLCVNEVLIAMGELMSSYSFQ